MTNLNQNNIEVRELYDHVDDVKNAYVSKPGVTLDLINEISSQKNEPEWMRVKRLASFEFYNKAALPKWGPDLSKLNLDEIVYYVRPDVLEATNWKDVPQEIKNTFDKLGIPEAEKEALGGVGAQFDGGMIYHNLKKKWEDKGVIFENMDVAVQKYPELVKKYFMTQCVPINDHKFVSLHGAVWSGGTFIYVPKNVEVDLPLQAYFRMNAPSAGQFEHTLIIADEGSKLHYIEGCSAPRYNSNSLHAGCVEIFVHKGARVRYSSIENWSKNTYNLNTKRALVDEDGVIEWVNGNMGSGVTMLYPASVLRGRGARSDSLGIAFAGPGQHQDTGMKVIHAAPDTKSTILAKSISSGDGITTYRGLVKVMPIAINSSISVNCDALLMNENSVSQTFPTMKIDQDMVDIAHEATVGKIGEDEIFYLMSRGFNETQALQMVVAGFIEPIIKALPLEYALELNKLIELEME